MRATALALTALAAARAATDLEITLDATIIARTGEMFSSFSFDTTALFGVQRPKIDFRSKQLRALAKNLGPAYLRLGGSLQDSVVNNMTGAYTHRLPEPSRMPLYYLGMEEWEAIEGLVDEANLRLVYGLNGKLGRQTHVKDPQNAVWNSSNAEMFLRFVAGRPKGRPFAVELGNENNCFNKSENAANISAAQLLDQFRTLRGLVDQHAPGVEIWGSDPSITGDVLGQCITEQYWGKKDLLGQYTEFMDLGAAKYVDKATWHYYAQAGSEPTSTAELLLTDEYQDRIKQYDRNATEAVRSLPIVLGETSSFWAGGKANVSNRFASGFWLIGQSGFLAEQGYLAMVRQDFAGGSYGLVDMESDGTFSPNPDYFTTALYQRLVGPHVARSAVAGGKGRGFGFCLRGGAAGDAVVTFMNTSPEARDLRILAGAGATIGSARVYELSSCDGGLQGKLACLNGKALRVDPRSWALPAMLPRHAEDGSSVRVGGHTYGFVVLPGALPGACAGHEAAEQGEAPSLRG